MIYLSRYQSESLVDMINQKEQQYHRKHGK